MKKIAICKTEGFCPRWVDYCKKNNLDYKIVNPYDTDIIKQVEDCDAFMWHHSQANYKDKLFAKELIYSLELAGKRCFPNYNTTWHFDDKVAQKYLLEAIGAPLVPSYVFYTKKEAKAWINNATFPKVFKLRGGAGAANVLLVKNKRKAKGLVRQAFRKGFSNVAFWGDVKERIRKWRLGKLTFVTVIKGFCRLFVRTDFRKLYHKEKGYVYFQDFMPNNTYDIRVCVVGEKAFAIKRMVREKDFRASGSGLIYYGKEEFDEQCVKLAFEMAKKLKLQSVGFDFVFDEKKNPWVVEMSYGFVARVYDTCSGYWTSDMTWHEGAGFDFCGWMVEDLINEN
ncbi:MAG: hypothetical protein IKQ46_17225 [Bacteroidales bacterium]|nr:hypothetical protein [Bacteroidales bacterium]MBR4498051.1 hypothetical protein [Bacteroidales bacterium]